jgi:catechol 2,3-dioxygenase-like lactoylglutathione lyase family enzyme
MESRPTPFSLNGFDFDHTSFAVRDVLSWARRLRADLGATPIFGEVLREFRYLLLYVGNADRGARLELMEPCQRGFLDRYLAKHGEGPHHLTFTVPDLGRAVADARSLGLTVVGESYEHPQWREAFIVPDGHHRVVLQLAQSDRTYPEPAELLTTHVRDAARFPSSPEGTDPTWWASLWQTAIGSSARLGTTHLGTADLAFSRRFFEDALGASTEEGPGYLEFSWPSGSVRVHASDRPGVAGMHLHDSVKGAIRIGSATLGNPAGTARSLQHVSSAQTRQPRNPAPRRGHSSNPVND